MKTTLKITVAALILGALTALGIFIAKSYMKNESVTVFKTEEIKRADILRTISATGTVEPEELINVGAQVNGKIMAFGKDIDGKNVDFGSRVKAGSVLAQIDDVVYKAELQEAEASREQAEASILSSESSIKESEANEVLARQNWERAQILYKKGAMTKSDYDSYEATYYAAVAQTSKSKAGLAQAKASLSIAKASLTKAKRNVEYCEITSPVDGIIIDRRVSIGQTVVSNQTASSIFLVAKDFKKMQVWVSVNEADVGAVRKGMPVEFACDAFPGMVFKGSVYRLRMNATLSSNVVTYIVEVNAENDEDKLIPYLTANVKFIQDERRNVLSVSSAALRYTPSPALAAATPGAVSENEAVLWKHDGNGRLVPVTVKLGLNNGISAEIITDKLAEGDLIVTGTEEVEASSDAASGSDAQSNPFLPKMPKFPKRGSAGQKERAAGGGAGK